MNFKLEVKGIGSELVARLYQGDKLIEEWFPRDIKSAHKDAEGIARAHKEANVPSSVLTHEKSFVL